MQALTLMLRNPTSSSLEEFAKARRSEKQIINQITQELTRRFVTTLDREDIEAMARALYRIPKSVEKLGERIFIIPEFLVGINLAPQLQILQQSAALVKSMVGELRNKQSGVENLQKHIADLHRLERDADKLMLEATAQLWSEAIEAKRAIFLKGIYQLFRKVADRCGDVAHAANQILLKNF